MKNFIGSKLMETGLVLWKHGGWTEAERYDDLKITGKLGFRMFTKGVNMLNITPDMIQKALHG